MVNRCKWLAFFLAIIISVPGFAQHAGLQVQGVTPDLYVMHTVQPKENWYSVGRLYNVSPRQLAPYNHQGLDKALAIGQQVRIPLTAENFSQDGNKAADEVLVPVRHTIQEKEWLYRVSVNYNKVPIESLEKWNGIHKDQARAGLDIIVGYLKVKPSQSALASKTGTGVMGSGPVAAATVPPKKTEELPLKKTEEKKAIAAPVEYRDAALSKNNTSRKEESQPVNTGTGSNSSLSYFSSQYEETGKSISGNAGIFKSTSGWKDGKFYALVNNVPVGTIVKVNNPVSGKTIYAKVLGSLPDMKESLGLISRLSDAAAAQLEGNGAKFSIELRY